MKFGVKLLAAIVFFSMNTSLQAMTPNRPEIETSSIKIPYFDQGIAALMPTSVLQAYLNLKYFGFPHDVSRYMLETYFTVNINEPYIRATQSTEYAKLLENISNKSPDLEIIVIQLKKFHTLHGIAMSVLLLQNCCQVTSSKLEDITLDGKTLLHQAINEPEVTEILLKSSNDLNTFICAQDNSGQTVLFYAILETNIATIKLLISAASRHYDFINIKNKNGMTAWQVGRVFHFTWNPIFSELTEYISQISP